jgi:hypothetical protein
VLDHAIAGNESRQTAQSHAGSLQHVARQFQIWLHPPVIQIIKEDAAKSASLLSVADDEVLVTPLLELGEKGWIMPADR